MIKVLIISIFISTLSFAKTQKKAPVETKWQKLERLITQEENHIKSLKNLGPKLQWRLLELKTERLKLLKEKENQKFLNASFKIRKKRKKAWFFRESKSFENKIRRTGLALIKKYKRFKYNADIYYTLALNSRDYGSEKYTERYLRKALKVAIPRSPLIHYAKTSLAEYYYNTKKYKKAIRYYRSVLKNKDDEWHSKHLYNISWCYVKTKKYDLAIKSAVEAYFESKTPEYIDVAPQVLQSIGLFYVLGNREEEGASFYIKNVQAPGKYIIKMAKKTADNGSFPKADYLLTKALENSIEKKDRDEEVSLHLARLDFFRNFKKFNRYFKTAQTLQKLDKEAKLKKEHQEQAVDKLVNYVGYLQLRFTKNNQKDLDSHNEKKREEIITYFDILISLNSKQTDDYRFYQGETLFSVQLYKEALSFYQKALEYSKKKLPLKKAVQIKAKKRKTLNKKISSTKENFTKEEKEKIKVRRRKIFDSLLASLENGSFNKSIEYNYTVYTYKNHIDLYPIDPRSKLIYPKLFNTYFSKKKISSSLIVLNKYIKYYVGDIKIQRAMFTQIMDHYIETKNTDQISEWITRLEKGFLKYDKKYIESAIVILGKILFQGYQELDKKGEKGKAAKGYISLFENKKYPPQIKAKASFKASLLYIETGDIEKSLKWMKKALTIFKKDEAFKRRVQVHALTIRLKELQNFRASASLSSFYHKMFCDKKFKQKEDFYISSVRFSLINGELKKAKQALKRRCGVSPDVESDLFLEIGGHLVRHRNYKSFFSFYKENKNKLDLQNFFRTSFIDIYWDSVNQNKKKLKASMKKVFKDIIAKGITTKEHKEMQVILKWDNHIRYIKNKKIKSFSKLKKFNEELFNSELEKNVTVLKKITASFSSYIASGQADIILRSYKILNQKYQNLAHKILQFNPQGVPKEYEVGFKGAMKGVAQNLLNESRKYAETGKGLIYKNDILSLENPYFTSGPNIVKKVNHRHPASLYILPFDQQKGGRR